MAPASPMDEDELRRIVNVLVHDLRNPLAAVVTNLGFARRLVGSASHADELGEVIDDSQAACDVLRHLLANLDVVAQAGHGRTTLLELKLAPICSEVVERCRPRAELAGVTLEWVDNGSERAALVDRSLLHVALENLITNALQHAPRGSVVTIRLDAQTSGAKVSVVDRGGAIPPERRDDAVAAAGQWVGGRREGARYSRGAGLFVARLAAEANGLEFGAGGEGETSILSLSVPGITR